MGGSYIPKVVKRDPCGENVVTGTASFSASQPVWSWLYQGPKPFPAGPAPPNPPPHVGSCGSLEDLNNQASLGARDYAQTAMDLISKDQC